MDNKFRYQKSFLIFDEEDSGFGTEQRPSGHVKVEIRDGRGKLFCQVSNLTEDKGKVEYKLFVIMSDDSLAVPVLAGNIELKRNKGELEWGFDPYDVDKTGIAFDRFNVVAILADYEDSQNNSVVCPLAAYKGSKVEWRRKLNKVLKEEKSAKEILNQNPKDDDIINKDKCVKAENESNKKEVDNKISKHDELCQNVAENGEINKENEFVTAQEPVVTVDNGIVSKKDNDIKIEKPAESAEKNKKSNAIEPKVDKLIQNQENAKSYSSFDGSKLFGMYSGDGKDNNSFNTNCMNCMFFNNKSTQKPDIKEFGYEELSKQFDLTFERYSPFSVKRTDYNWWKVASPVHLNNILYTFGIKIPVLFNPLVLMAHYKYKHLIVGIYQDEKRERDYVVCGIPGVYWVDEKPFGNACRWAQVEGNTPVYGAFGYWIVYINPKTGKILAIEE
ncbi:DUF7922 domain-containing protein [Acetivibrio cellulolyticus]|uniref:DUF7922 domain-containing protein n=1 Tax=Acetivibrio cellulolyticus TaxID=35830 RepID=UPI0001E2DE93|nr:hypothetical protein [Acetivibrio cellulolyticus]